MLELAPESRGRIREELSRVQGGLNYFWYHVRERPLTLIAFVILGLEIILIIFAPWIAPYDPETASPAEILQPPSAKHWMGTDNSGMDVFSRLIYAGRIDLTIAITGVGLGMLIGIPCGAIFGYFRGWLSEIFMRVMEFLQSFPIFITAMALVAATGNRIENIIYVMAFLNIPVFVRLVRSEVLSMRETEYIEAAKCCGNSELGLVFRHVLPNTMSSSLVQASVSMGVAILLTAGLSFIGAGVRSPTPEWGVMMSTGAQDMILGYWWPSIFPGIAIGLIVFSLAIVGETFGLLLDPARRR